jgi:hypothetical protein
MRPSGVVAMLGLLAATLGACGGSAGDPEAFCAEARAFRDAFVAIEAAPEPETREAFAAFLGQLREAAARARALTGPAPGGIRKDMRAVADATEQLSDTFQEAREPFAVLQDLAGQAEADPVLATDPEFLRRVEEAQRAVANPLSGDDQAETEEAGARVREYMEDECGLSFPGR